MTKNTLEVIWVDPESLVQVKENNKDRCNITGRFIKNFDINQK